MKYILVILSIILIANVLVAQAPIFKYGIVYRCESANNRYKLFVIPEKIIEPKYAIAIVKEKSQGVVKCFFKLNYLEGDDYIISDNGTIIIQLKSYLKSENMKFANGHLISEDRIPVSEIFIYKNGVFINSFCFNLVFYTYEDKTRFQKITLDIDKSKYLNLIGDTLYLISDTTIYKVNINDGKVMPAHEKIMLKSYKFKRKKLNQSYLRKYHKYDDLLNTNN